MWTGQNTRNLYKRHATLVHSRIQLKTDRFPILDRIIKQANLGEYKSIILSAIKLSSDSIKNVSYPL